MNNTSFLAFLALVALVVFLWRGQKAHLAAQRARAKPAPKQKKPIPTAQELANAVSDRKGYNRLLDKLEKAEQKVGTHVSYEADGRHMELVTALQDAVELVEAKYPQSIEYPGDVVGSVGL
jgi:hypothetical protein